MALINKNQSISLSAQSILSITDIEDAVYAIIDSMAKKEATSENI